MIFFDQRRYSTIIRRSKTLDKSQYLSAEKFNLLLADLLLDHDDSESKGLIKKAMKTGTLKWNAPNGPVVIKKKKKIVNFKRFKRG